MARNYRNFVVADLYQLGRMDGKFDKNMKKLKREDVLISADRLEEVNNNTSDNGKLYVVDQKATDAYYARCEEKKNIISARKELQKSKAGEILSNAVKTLVGSDKPEKEIKIGKGKKKKEDEEDPETEENTSEEPKE